MNKHHDQAPSAILELVDGPRDMRFVMTAKSLVRERLAAGENAEKGIREITARNVAKVTRFRPQGEMELMKEVRRLESGEKKGKAAVEVEEEVKDEDEEEYDAKVKERPVREGWERWDHFARDERRRRKVGYKIREFNEREEEKKRLRD